MLEGMVRKSVVSLLDTGSRLQAPIAANYVEFLRRRHPAHSPDQIAGRLEQQYLITVLGSGVAVGLSAAVPGVGTLIGLAATAAESAFFLEVSTVYTLATTAAHGIDPAQTPRRRDLVLEVVLGEDGMQIIEKNAAHPAKNWETVLADRIPGLRNMRDSPPKRFLVHFIAKRGVLMFGRVLPAGIGAVIGGAGNLALGKAVISNAQRALGPAPQTWPSSESLAAENASMAPSVGDQGGTGRQLPEPSSTPMHAVDRTVRPFGKPTGPAQR
jgi:hypothetical protein